MPLHATCGRWRDDLDLVPVVEPEVPLAHAGQSLCVLQCWRANTGDPAATVRARAAPLVTVEAVTAVTAVQQPASRVPLTLGSRTPRIHAASGVLSPRIGVAGFSDAPVGIKANPVRNFVPQAT